jgi:hypothetical protein
MRLEEDEMGEICGTYGDARHVCNILIGKSKETRLLRSPRLRRENNIGMNLEQAGCDVVDWSPLAQHMVQCGALVNKVMNHRII